MVSRNVILLYDIPRDHNHTMQTNFNRLNYLLFLTICTIGLLLRKTIININILYKKYQKGGKMSKICYQTPIEYKENKIPNS